MTPYYEREGVRIFLGDCRDILPILGPIDSVITDPPYELAFMGKAWDRSGVSFDPETWRLILAAAKPGATLLSFGGTRTWHRIAVAIEDAGWELRDTICWLYGSGFPKSLDISKAIDKGAGVTREVVGRRTDRAATPKRDIRGGRLIGADSNIDLSPITAPATDAAREWDGWGTALKPAFEPIIVAMKPLDGTFAANALAHGIAGINIDGCRIGIEQTDDIHAKNPHTVNQATNEIYGAFKAGSEYKVPAGRWPANVILKCTCEETREGRIKSHNPGNKRPTESGRHGIYSKHVQTPHIGYAGPDGRETVRMHTDPDCPCAMLDAQSGELHSNSGNLTPMMGRAVNTFGHFAMKSAKGRTDSGGASRFFYCAKASRSERERYIEGIESVTGAEAVERQPDTAGLDSPRAGAGRTAKRLRNDHATVKPLALMRYLCRLTKTPTGGIVLDPFMGSGTTLIAARLEGRPCIGIEKDERACEIAVKRLAQEVLAL